MKLEVGELITLDDDKEYICLSRITYEDKDYVYLMSNFKPLEVRFALENIVGEDVELTIVGDPELKKVLLELFNNKVNN